MTMQTDNIDIRWLQRFSNYKNAFYEIENEVEEATSKEFSVLEKKGLIKSFEIVQTLCWNVLKDFLEYSGHSDIKGSRDAFTLAHRVGIISTSVCNILLETINSRNQTAHTYHQEDVNNIYLDIVNKYYEAFRAVYLAMQKEQTKI